MHNSLTDTWGIGGDGDIPVIVTIVTPDGAMTGAGSTSVDVGGSIRNGLVTLTVLETTGGFYTITVYEYSMTLFTTENTSSHEVVFTWEAASTTGDMVSIGTENGYISATLEPYDAWDPGLQP